MSNQECTIYEVRENAAWVTLNRPEARNALSPELVDELYTHLRHGVVSRVLRRERRRALRRQARGPGAAHQGRRGAARDVPLRGEAFVRPGTGGWTKR